QQQVVSKKNKKQPATSADGKSKPINNDRQESKESKKELAHLKMVEEELNRALIKEKELGDLKSRFVTMASHEFRTPLSTVLSSASLLAKYTEGSEQDKRNKHIDRIKSAVYNLTDILDEFLSIGKIEDGRIVTRYN